MYCGKVTVSTATAKDSLRADGFVPGTTAYLREMNRRFEPDADAKREPRLIEREDWDPNKKIQPVYSEVEIEAMLQADGFTPGTCDHWNEKYRRFTPTGAGSREWTWSEGYSATA